MHCELDTFTSPQSFDNLSGDRQGYKYALQSQPFAARNDFAVGFMVGKELHLVPVSTVQQFTPVVGQSAVEKGSIRVEEVHSSKRPEEATIVGSPIADMLSRQLRRQRSFAINSDAQSERELDVFPSSSVESRLIAKRLVCPILTSSSYHRNEASQLAAVNALFPPESIVDHGSSVPRDVLLRYACEHSVAAQVKDLLYSSSLLDFSTLMTFVVEPKRGRPGGRSLEQEVLDALRNCAVYMHGVWVSKTSPFTGMAAALREVVLLKFQQSRDGSLFRRDLNALVTNNSTLMKTTIHQILQSISTLNPSASPQERVWKLKGSSETVAKTFADMFGDAVRFQEASWARRTAAVLSHMTVLNSGRTPRQLHLLPVDVSLTQGATSAPPGALSSSSAQDLVRVRAFARRIFAEHGVMNKQRAKELIAKSREEQFPTATNQILSLALQEEVQQFTASTWVLKQTGDREVDKVRPFLFTAALELQTFTATSVTQLATKKYAAFLEQTTGQEAPGELISSVAAQKVIKEIAQFQLGEKLWHLKSGNLV